MRFLSEAKTLPLISLGVLGASFMIAPEALPSRFGCWMKAFLGIPCPACGMTHAFCAIGHGRWAEAWTLNPFSYLCFALVLFIAVDGLLGGHLYKRVSDTIPLDRWTLIWVGAICLGWVLRLI